MPNEQEMHEQAWWDLYANLIVSDDGLHAFLHIKEIDATLNFNQLTYNGLLQWISRQGIVFGINESLLQSVVSNIRQYSGGELEVACGVPLISGKNAELQVYASEERLAHPQILADGRVDFFHVTKILDVREGMMIAKKIPMEPGVDGRNVYGKIIPHERPKDIRLPVGKNVKVAEDGLTLIAVIDGHVVYTPNTNQIHVFNTYTVKGNVDFSVGNIKFSGNVHILGNVLDGFHVEAEGDIRIDGTVGAAIVQAGGNIVIRGGIQSRGKGLVQAGGTVSTRFIQTSKVAAGMDCLVLDSIMHSDVTAMRNVILSSQKSVIVGGITRAGERISAKSLGSPMATVTELEGGVRPDLRAELLTIDKELKDLINTEEKSNKALALLKMNVLQGKPLSADKVKLQQTIEKTLEYTKMQYQEKQIHRKEIEQQLILAKNATIIAEDQIFPSVKIFLSNHVYIVLDIHTHVRFVIQNDEIAMVSI